MVKIQVRSHGIVIRCPLGRANDEILTLIKQNQGQIDIMARMRDRSAPPVLKDIFAIIGNGFYIVNRSMLQPIKNRLSYLKLPFEEAVMGVNNMPLVDFQWKVPFQLRKDQIPVGEFLQNATNTFSLMVSSPPGSGKTVMAINHCIHRNKRTMFIMRPSYMEQWEEVLLDLKEEGFIVTNLVKDDIFMLASKKDIDRLELELFKGTFDKKIIIASNKVYDRYIKSYVEYESSQLTDTRLAWPDKLNPLNFCELLGIGTVVADEVHSDLRFWHSFASTLHVELFLGLSGTMVSRDQFILKIQQELFPEKARYDTLKRNPYINYLTVSYALSFPGMKTENRGIRAYNQTAYEGSISSNNNARLKYFEIIRKVVEFAYVKQKEKEPDKRYRCLLYTGKVEFGRNLSKYLSKHFPNLKIGKYNAGDAYIVLTENDLTVSTPGKASTAVDISGLITVIDTTNSNSLQSNIQRVGRLRNIDTKLPLTYVQLNNRRIDKHMKYHNQRLKDLKPFIKSYFNVNLEE